MKLFRLYTVSEYPFPDNGYGHWDETSVCGVLAETENEAIVLIPGAVYNPIEEPLANPYDPGRGNIDFPVDLFVLEDESMLVYRLPGIEDAEVVFWLKEDEERPKIIKAWLVEFPLIPNQGSDG